MSKLTQKQTQQRHLDSNIERQFAYQTSLGGTRYCPFRVGDIVRVKNWGEVYSTYFKAFAFLTGSREPPYYSCNDLYIEKRRREDGDKQLFKIVKVAEHGEFPCILFYIQDRAKRGVVIDPKGLKLVKQFPLRKNETINIVLEKIK